ncbi:MAG: cell wall-active antibiotics response protein [Oscillospiraceae bacterium]|nr:cell wall-active antibiotics response protein [Oscillospiraceae bacterium]
MARKYKQKTENWGWAAFWLIVPALVLINHFSGFVQLGIWSIITGAVAVAMLIYCIGTLSLASLPFPIATLYFLLQTPLELPFIPFWTLVMVTVPLVIALHVLIPRRFKTGRRAASHWTGECGFGKDEDFDADEEMVIDENDDENNPYISVKFGGASRYLHSDCLESLDLRCAFGGMDIYMDQVQLSPNGATVYVDCKFGGIDIYVPSHWRVIDQMSAAIGASEVDDRLQSADADAPTLTLRGNVSFGGVDVNRIKGSRH